MGFEKIVFGSKFEKEVEVLGKKIVFKSISIADSSHIDLDFLDKAAESDGQGLDLKKTVKGMVDYLSICIVSIDGEKPVDEEDTRRFLLNQEQGVIIQIFYAANSELVKIINETSKIRRDTKLSAKMDIVFELGGLPNDEKYLNLNEVQWAALIRHNVYRKEIMADMLMEAAEYVIMLCSPYPREAMKMMESRRQSVKEARIKAGYIDAEDPTSDPEKKLFKKEHRNTTFFDDIAKHAGKDMSAEIAHAFGETDKDIKTESTEMYEPDFDDLDFINKAIATKNELQQQQKEIQKLDTIEF